VIHITLSTTIQYNYKQLIQLGTIPNSRILLGCMVNRSQMGSWIELGFFFQMTTTLTAYNAFSL